MKCLVAYTILLMLASCNDQVVVSQKDKAKDTVISKTVEAAPLNDSMVLPLTKEILQTIKEKNYAKLSKYIDPDLGIRFSPYGYVDTTEDVKLSVKDFEDLITNKNKKIKWGTFDGSGDPIEFSLTEYFKRFIYDVNFLNPEKLSLNGGGTGFNNIDSIYKGHPYTDSYFSGFDKKYEGMDWRSLILVFRNNKNNFYLIGIIHNQWTI